MSPLTVLSHFQITPLLAARETLTDHMLSVATSLDLNRSQTEVELDREGVRLPDGRRLSWSQMEAAAGNKNACYLLEDSELWKIQQFSEQLNRMVSLMPTAGAPTMLVAGFPMHRIKGIDPRQDTILKLKTVRPLVGRVLDTTMGLGYTAIEAAKSAEQVITIELDPTVVEMCRLNPWSQALFTTPNISRRIGDAYEEVAGFADDSFQRIIHDPPTFSLAGELYSATFYRELRRVLSPKGRLFHYIGDLKSRSGSRVARGAAGRLKDAGFRRVVQRPEAFGLVAYP